MPDAARPPFESAFPELAIATDPDRMAALVAGALAGGDVRRVTACRVETFRIRSRARATLTYRVDVDGTAQPAWPVVGQLQGGPDRVAHARELHGKLEERAAQLTGWAAPLAPVGAVPELGMVLLTYPFDRRVSGLAAVAAGPPPAVAAALEEALEVPAGSWTSELVRYRPGRGAVLRWAHPGRGVPVRVYAKVYADGEEATAPAWLPPSATAPFVFERTVLDAPEHQTVVRCEATGTPLDAAVIAGAEAAIGEAFARAARALAAFHRGPHAPARRVGADEHHAGLRRRAAYVSWARPDLAARVDGILDAVGEAVRDAELAPTHRDLKPDHLLLRDDGLIGLIDLDSSALADPMIDPGTLLARIHTLPLRRPVARARPAAALSAFTTTYLPLVPPTWRRRLPPHVAATLLEVAGGLIRRQAPGWPAAAEALVADAERAVAGALPWA